jgi:EthD domain-containing protein
MEDRTMKFMSLISRAPGQDRTEFQQWFLREHAPAVLKQAPRLAHYMVNINDVSPKMATAPLDSAPVPYDVVTETWIDGDDASSAPAKLYNATVGRAVAQSLGSRSAGCQTYLVSEVVQKDQQTFALGQRAPGVNLVSAITWAAGKTDETGRQGWRKHGPLACRVHIGMTRYVQNYIEQAVTAGAPGYTGVALLYFPTLHDLEQRLYDTPQNAEIIAADVKSFVDLQKIVTFYTSQHSLK